MSRESRMRLKEIEASIPNLNPKKTDWGAMSFVFVFLIYHVAWFVYYWAKVNIGSIFMAFQDPYTGEWTTKFMEAAFKNFTENGAPLMEATWNTLFLTVKDAFVLFFHLAIVYFIYKKIAGYRFFQFMFYLPAIISEVALTMAFKYFVRYDGPVGELAKILNIGLDHEGMFIDVFQTKGVAFPVLVFYGLWMGWGGNMLLLGGAMARIPIEILESARLDGVGSGRELVQMILPLLWPTVSTLFILKLTNMFGSSAGALLFCGFYADQVGANTISLYIYTALYGPGANTLQAANSVSAVGLIFTCIAVPTVMIMRWLVEKVPVVEY